MIDNTELYCFEMKKLCGQNIQVFRTKHGLSQSDLAEKLCCTRTAISKWERGFIPSWDFYFALIPLFGLEAGDMFKGYTREEARFYERYTKSEFTIVLGQEPRGSPDGDTQKIGASTLYNCLSQNFAKSLWHTRKERGISRNELAIDLGCKKRTIMKWEKALFLPKWNHYLLLNQILGFDPGSLFHKQFENGRCLPVKYQFEARLFLSSNPRNGEPLNVYIRGNK